MALFATPFYGPGFYSSDQTPFKSLFRMLDEFDNYSRQQGTSDGAERTKRGSAVRAFNPKFDVRETDDAYELHGELPGIERDHVNIQFTDPQTLVVSGRSERSYTSGTPLASLLEHASHRATVEDAQAEDDKDTATQVVKSANDPQQQQQQQQQKEKQQPADKYWLSERSVGEFSRSFCFPARVDQDAVQASLTNGVLGIKVPKAKKQESRRIAVN